MLPLGSTLTQMDWRVAFYGYAEIATISLVLFVQYLPLVSPATGVCLVEEEQNLMQFKKTVIDPFGVLNSWTDQQDCCLWKGVGCDNSTGEVIQLNLSNSSLNGSLQSSSLLGLRMLKLLDLHGNKFTGSLSPLMASLPVQLETINLSENQLFGEIPAFLSARFRNLQNLDLSSNILNGNLTTALCDLLEAQFLKLANNNLTGEIPSCFGKLSKLTNLDLTNNSLQGHVPSSLSSCSNLVRIKLSRNQLSGTIPTDLGGLFALETLSLNNNQLSGTIPVSLANCENMTVFDVCANRLTGPFPSWVTSWKQLRVLNLGVNLLDGPISYAANISELGSLQVLNVGGNQFFGEIPGNLSGLKGFIDASDIESAVHKLSNLYEDSIFITVKGADRPYEYVLRTLTSFDFSHNMLSGPIPLELGKLEALRYLNLSRNHLTGSIPSSLATIKVLESLDLSTNNLDGKLPDFSATTTLAVFYVYNNNLSGEIPYEEQTATFENTSYLPGNKGLCGRPIDVKCPPPPVPIESPEDKPEFLSWTAFAIAAAVSWSSANLIIILWRPARKYVFYPDSRVTGDDPIGRLSGDPH